MPASETVRHVQEDEGITVELWNAVVDRFDSLVFHVESYRRTTDQADQADYNVIQRAIDAAAEAAEASGVIGVVQMARGLYVPYRSINQLGLSRVEVAGAGMDATIIRPTANLNGGDDGVPTDPSQCHVFNASNGALDLASYPSYLIWRDFTIDGSDTPGWDGLEYFFYIGHSRSGIETQNVNYPAAYRVKLVNLPTGITFGNSTPNFDMAFLDGRIEHCVSEGTPNSIAHHYRYGLDDVAPYGLAFQMGVMRGGRFCNNRILNASGAAYAVVGNEGTVIADNYVEGYDMQAAAVGFSVGTMSIDFGARHCKVSGNISKDAGGYLFAGNVVPSIFNGFQGEPSATGTVIDASNIVTGTALAPYPSPPTLEPGVRIVNNSGKDAAVNFAGAGTITSIKVGDRDDGSQLVAGPNAIRSVVVPNGMGVTVEYTGAVTWVWAPARVEYGSTPSAPLLGASQPFLVQNSSGVGQIITILPTATDGPGGDAITSLALPPATGVAFSIGGVPATPMGIRRNMLYLPNGATLSMSWTTATVEGILRAYTANADLVLTGWEWRWDSVVTWEAAPAVPGTSGSPGTVYNALGIPVCVRVETGTVTDLVVANANGVTTQTVQVESANPATEGKMHFVIDPGGSVTPTWSVTRPTWTWYAAPNALLPHVYGTSGSTGSTLGLARDCTIGLTSRLAPSRGIQLIDFVRTALSAHVADASEWRPDYSIVLADSGVSGGGCKGVAISGHLSDSRSTESVIAHYLDNGDADVTDIKITSYVSETSGSPAINPGGGGAGRVDSAGAWGPGA